MRISMMAKAALCAGLLTLSPAYGAWAQTSTNDQAGHPANENQAAQKEQDLLNEHPFHEAEPDTLDFFGHARQRATYIDDLLFGQQLATGDWFYTHRYSLGAKWTTQRFQALFELSSAFIHEASDGNSPVEENRLAIQRAWIEAHLIDTEGLKVEARIGRDEWRLGSQRLVGWRDGTNVRRRFDGIRAFVNTPQWDIQVLGGFEVENDIGVLDDEIGLNRALWGVYAVHDAPIGLPGSVDVYYLGFDDERAVSVDRVGHETRHSVGTRYWGHGGGWDWNIEAVYQFGQFRSPGRSGDISAWTLASITGFTFENLPLKPRLALSANVASGDGDPDDDTVTTFNALFPRGSYFSELAQLGPRNFYNLNPYLTLTLADGLELITDINFYWRYSLADGIYDPPGGLLRGPSNSQERFVNTATSVNLEYAVNENIFIGALYTHATPGAFIKDTDPNARSVDFFEFTFRIQF